MMFVAVVVLALAVVGAVPTSPKPGHNDRLLTSANDATLHAKAGPGGPKDQLVAFNNLEYHAHNRFFAKALSYNEVKTVAEHVGPFAVTFTCTDASISAYITLTNIYSYDITYHGNFLSGADSTKVNLLSSGDNVTLLIGQWANASAAGNGVGAPASKGAVFTSNGYFLALSNADSFIMSVSNDDDDDMMPNSDCTVAGFMEFAHPQGGNYYDGFLYEDVLLQKASTSTFSSSMSLFGGVFFGMICGAAVVVVTTLMITKNRSLLLHSVGYYDLPTGKRDTSSMEDTSSSGLVLAANASSLTTGSREQQTTSI